MPLSCCTTDEATCFLYRSADATKSEPITLVSETETSAVPKIRRVIKVGEKEVPEDVLTYVRQQALSALANCRAQAPTRSDPLPQPSAGILDEGSTPGILEHCQRMPCMMRVAAAESKHVICVDDAHTVDCFCVFFCCFSW